MYICCRTIALTDTYTISKKKFINFDYGLCSIHFIIISLSASCLLKLLRPSKHSSAAATSYLAVIIVFSLSKNMMDEVNQKKASL